MNDNNKKTNQKNRIIWTCGFIDIPILNSKFVKVRSKPKVKPVLVYTK